jgi:hypothetical protein
MQILRQARPVSAQPARPGHLATALGRGEFIDGNVERFRWHRNPDDDLAAGTLPVDSDRTSGTAAGILCAHSFPAASFSLREEVMPAAPTQEYSGVVTTLPEAHCYWAAKRGRADSPGLPASACCRVLKGGPGENPGWGHFDCNGLADQDGRRDGVRRTRADLNGLAAVEARR